MPSNRGRPGLWDEHGTHVPRHWDGLTVSLVPFAFSQSSEVEPWERQPDETAKAYDAFNHYLDQPPATRTCRAVAVALGKSRKLITNWSAKHGWVERAAAWDAEQARVARQAQLGGRGGPGHHGPASLGAAAPTARHRLGEHPHPGSEPGEGEPRLPHRRPSCQCTECCWR